MGTTERCALVLGLLCLFSGLGCDGPSDVDAGPGPSDAAARDAAGPDAAGRDAAADDADGDGVPAAQDCDDTDPAVGSTASRPCSSECADGVEMCADGEWGACNASTDCACDTVAATRIATCGACGSQSQECGADLRWRSTGPCLGQGECMAATTETEAFGACGERARLCDAECAWTDWEVTVTPAGECEPGAARVNSEGCGPGELRNETCSATCVWEPDTTECISGCPGTPRTSPAWSEELCIPAGPFIRGQVGVRYAEPVAEVTLSAYWIDRYPVTNRRFRACMDAGVCSNRSDLGRNSLADPDRDDYPVQGVSWEQARDFCEWDGRRLPTEAELEKAARGPAPRAQQYLWDGDAYRCDLLPIRSCGYVPDERLLLLGFLQDPYDALPGTRSYYGVELLEGVGGQWAYDFWGRDYYADPSSRADPQGPAEPASHVQRGTLRESYCEDAVFGIATRVECTGDGLIRCARSE